MAYGLILKTTITNIINVHLKILIISPPWPFGPTVIVWFRFSPNLSHVLSTCSGHITLFSHLLKSVTHVPHHGIHCFHHLRHGLHLEFKFYIGRGWCVLLIWHDSTCKNWLVVKHILTSLVFRSNTLNILTRSHLWSHLLAQLQPTPNKTNLAAQSKYKYIWLKNQ